MQVNLSPPCRPAEIFMAVVSCPTHTLINQLREHSLFSGCFSSLNIIHVGIGKLTLPYLVQQQNQVSVDMARKQSMSCYQYWLWTIPFFSDPNHRSKLWSIAPQPKTDDQYFPIGVLRQNLIWPRCLKTFEWLWSMTLNVCQCVSCLQILLINVLFNDSTPVWIKDFSNIRQLIRYNMINSKCFLWCHQFEPMVHKGHITECIPGHVIKAENAWKPFF